MMPELKYNLINYLKNNNKKQSILYILSIILIIIVLIILFAYKSYSVEIINGRTICEENKCVVKYYNIQSKNDYDFVKIKNKEYKIESIEYGEIQFDSANNFFQEVTLILQKYRGKNNEIIEMKFYKNKERLIKKIYNLVVER